MNDRPNPADWATNLALECITDVHCHTFVEALNAIAVRLRDTHARGYAEARFPPREITLLDIARRRRPADDTALMQYALSLGLSSPRELRERQARRREDVQFDHDRDCIGGEGEFGG